MGAGAARREWSPRRCDAVDGAVEDGSGMATKGEPETAVSAVGRRPGSDWSGAAL